LLLAELFYICRTNDKTNLMKTTLPTLIAYGTINISGTNEVINICSESAVFGTMNHNNVTMQRKSKNGTFAPVDNRYFNNITELFTV